MKFLQISFLATVATISIASLAGIFSAHNDWCEVLSHLQLVWLALLTTLVIASLLMRNRVAICIAAIPLLYVSWNVFHIYLCERAVALPSEAKIRILQMNLWGGKNHKYQAAVDTIRREDPDVVGFSEVTGSWLKELKTRLPDYKYVIAEPQHGGIALFSKFPMEGEVRYFGEIKRPRIVSVLKIKDVNVSLILAHPVIPIRLAATRNAELRVLAEEAKNARRPAILAGDLNCTPWSSYFSDLLSAADLHDTECGFGPQPSWCALHPVVVFPIDHCLVSSDLTATRRQTLPAFGSDHLPVVVDLAVSKKP